MSILKHRPPAVEAQPKHRAPSWPGNSAADAPISFADIRRLPDPDWIGRSQNIAFALDAELLEPLEQTDWSARIAADWQHIDACWDLLKLQADGAADDFVASRYSYRDAERLLLTALADDWAERDDDRAALYVDIAAERALLAELAELAPFTAKGGC